jgi:glycosyl transferase family 2
MIEREPRLPWSWALTGRELCSDDPASNISATILNPCRYCARPPSLAPILYRSQVVIMPGTNSWQLRDGKQIIACNTRLFGHRHFLIGITHVRNEALILRDTLDYVGKHVDAIVAYDDASTDRTLEILGGHPKVALIVTNRSWEADIEARQIAEGRHRGLLLQTAREHLQFDWMFCFDADERVTGDLRGFIEGTHSSDYDGVRVQLFDAYMTPGDQAPYQADRQLLGFRRFLGPERRDILMLWRNRLEVVLAKHHGRKPGGVQHVFPFDAYGRKWSDRKGPAIHTQSDFMRPLYKWGDTPYFTAGSHVRLVPVPEALPAPSTTERFVHQ